MTDKLRTIRLYGKLGARFGRQYELAVSSPTEAVKALCVLLPGFEKYLMNAKDKGLGFSVFVGKKNLSEEQLSDQVFDGDIRIAPIILGSKAAGLFQIVLGVVLIVVGAMTSWAGGVMLIGMGISMVLGGITQMLAPHPKQMGAADSPENTASYSFNGPVNTQAQGNPVPLLYGRMKIGSAVVSAGIYAEDVYIAA